MKHLNKLNFRVLGFILAVIFVLGMIFFTVYSRAFSERQKPWVSLVLTEHRDNYMSFEITGVARPVGADDDAGDFDWIAVGTLYESDYINGTGIPPPLGVGYRVNVNTATMYYQYLHGQILAISGIQGDIEYTVGFVSGGSPINEGDEVLISRELTHLVEQPTLPITAVHFDVFENRHYVYVVVRRDGAWGREFVAQRRNVNLVF